MSELLTAAQMRAIEQAAIESGEVTGLELMERAGTGVVEAIFEEWPELVSEASAEPGLAREGGSAPRPAGPASPRDISGKRKRAVVLCGPGNNGGDGFVVARLLKGRGWDVEVFLYGDAEKLPPDARVNYERWLELGGVQPLTKETFELPHARHRALYVDALFGTGLARAVEGDVAWLLSQIRLSLWPFERSLRETERFVAIDVPTSLCSDSGKLLVAEKDSLAHFRADVTVSFHSPKLGHVIEGGPDLVGKLVVKGIGLPHRYAPAKIVKLADNVRQVGKEDWWLHKYSHGHALILSGGAGKTGAARLAARGALRVGAGLVTLGVPPSAQQEVACQITALMLQRIGDATALDVVLADQRINALCLGPGMGLERARALVPMALGAKRATVLDADALSAFAERPEELFEMLHEDVVLTPHGGEFARLFPDIAEKLAAVPTKGPAYSKVDATREAAARAGCVVLYKGADTVIADPSGRCSVNAAVYERAAPWLATAGSGDVLAGFITGLLARGFAPMAAAETAAWLHVECARAFGPGLIAEDLPEVLPQVLRGLEVT
ncbi:Bifunctional NAD(P)H-hydrate repair enzyme Nnr [Shimia sp. SK013]|uniref:bifunctional ADP-dependent NAD(P)H-hydrate dehydratase/NAD(P)H-hydrate epimerase n=1 Tax=Shimia sp. SK013 TaxID=1389006 RepID=UPI0006B629EE|nr:bifunctional ADP-dependent NAD(P)H-hydrate dehydratase/NAD(P)H-hydrate epimerase [Shimia sp. SK013]KPA22857.1 Bifunctional NAD(P)H-hydrate repair enzyme Nnr [Shimia sp. SK013]